MPTKSAPFGCRQKDFQAGEGFGKQCRFLKGIRRQKSLLPRKTEGQQLEGGILQLGAIDGGVFICLQRNEDIGFAIPYFGLDCRQLFRRNL